jgi:hypothetical protein
MAGVTVVIDGRLFEQGRVRSPVRIVTIRAGDLPFPQRHMRGAHELRAALQMALPAHFGLCSFIEERGLVAGFGQLEAVGGFLHQGVTVDAGDAPARVWAGFPVSLKSPLMAALASVVL